MPHVAPHKKQVVEDLASRFAQARVVGIANIHGIPAPQFQAIRRKLSGRASITVAKNNLLRLALQEASAKKPDLAKLGEAIEGQTAVVTADINPFKLFKELEATKTKAPARGGEIAPEDLWVRAGDTPFKPGPVGGERAREGRHPTGQADGQGRGPNPSGGRAAARPARDLPARRRARSPRRLRERYRVPARRARDRRRGRPGPDRPGGSGGAGPRAGDRVRREGHDPAAPGEGP